MALVPGAQLDELHGLARVYVEDEPDPVAQAQGIGGSAGQAPAAQPVVLGRGGLQGPAVVVAAAGLLDLVWYPGAEIRRQRLPLDCQHAMALQVSERAVVG